MRHNFTDEQVTTIQGCVEQAELYWDYRDGLSDAQVKHLLAGELSEIEEIIWQNNDEYIFNLEIDAICDAIKHLGLEPKDPCIGCLEEACTEACANFYDNTPRDGTGLKMLARSLHEDIDVPIDYNIEGLVRYTFDKYLALRLPVEHDPYWQEYSDVKSELRFFGIDPVELRQYFNLKGRWPKCPTRTNPLISVRDLAEAWANAPYGGYWYIMLDCRETLSLAIKQKLSGKMTLKKGSRIIIHDYLNGASGTDCHTRYDIVVNADEVFDDGVNSYGIQSCCAFVGEAWDGILVPREIKNGGKR